MGTNNYFTKDPQAILNYTINWGTNWLEDGDTLSTGTWTVPAGITNNAETMTTTTMTITLSGGTAGQSYGLVNHITTANGLEDDRTITIFIQDK